jgi:chromosome segregation ATPase
MSEMTSPPPSNPHANIVDFLRRLAGIMGGGGNATLLEQAAALIETLTERATVAEEAWRAKAEEHARAAALRGTAERAYDALRGRVGEMQAELAESNRLADSERNFFAGEARRLQGVADDAEARLKTANAELAELRETDRTSEDQRAEVAELQAELAALKTQLAENGRLADSERAGHAEETQRLRGTADDAETRLKAANAELGELRETARVSEDRRAEIAALQARLDEHNRFAESERTVFAEEARRLRGLADDAEARLKTAGDELSELRGTAERASEDSRAEVAALQTKLADSNQMIESERAARTEEMQGLRAVTDDAEARLKTIIAELGELRETARASEEPHPEMAALQAQLAERDRLADTERASHAEEAGHLRGLAEAAEARLKAANAELDELRGSMTAIDQSIAVVPVNSLELARTQFTFLAEDFAKHGDVISQTICEIGACAIDKALTGSLPPESAVSPLVRELLS